MKGPSDLYQEGWETCERMIARGERTVYMYFDPKHEAALTGSDEPIWHALGFRAAEMAYRE